MSDEKQPSDDRLKSKVEQQQKQIDNLKATAQRFREATANLKERIEKLKQDKEDVSAQLEEAWTTSLNKHIKPQEEATKDVPVDEKWYSFFLNYKGFSIVVILPMIIMFLYWGLIASNRYESSAVVALKNNEMTTSIPDSTLGLLTGMSSQSSSNDYLLINYILSWGMLDKLNEQLDLKKLYHQGDWFSRLESNPDQQDFLDYYNSRVSANYDPDASTITLTAQAYTAKEAQTILKTMVKDSQSAVDAISHTLAEQRMKFSEQQMSHAREKALKAQTALLDFQDKNGIVDPEASITAVSTIITGMQTELATAETQLTSLRSYLNPSSPEVVATQEKIRALKQQISKEKKALLSDESHKSSKTGKVELNELMSKYSWLKLNAEFAMTEYTAAMQSFEMAKVDTLRQQSYLVQIVSPTLPDVAAYPETWYNLLTLLIVLLAIYGIGRMIITIIMEHR